MVNINLPQLTSLQDQTIQLLFIKAGTALNQRQIARALNVTPPAILKALPRLKQENFITQNQDPESKRWSVRLNRNNHRVIQLKRAHNLKQIYISGLADFLEKEFAGACVIVFGSYSKGEDTFTSDVDIAIIGRKQKQPLLSNFEQTLERKININYYDSFNRIHKHLKENLCNGIVLAGGIEL